ncbi:hypothetical protein LPJ38_05065 [Bradyrhizobium daqingense]|uniref:Uncharacterized protein n=1 Tax=Bradyrhizobium daqingense TaxID=993502 RepID=A0A562LIT8_9BRAD|nr:hypothetical protein [Bradyrhizobium daqingense]TWI07501.1 hypothetical protein IQ17_01852 [Bradyrhizobium daqingense]UFS90165.1 hypothetical protein LPJ38_05065 [Bradyrhizobium daqingense]
MRHTNFLLGIIAASIMTFSPASLLADERREEPLRIQVNVSLFLPGPTGDTDEALKLRERARRSIYELAAGECAIVDQVLTKNCRLESVSVNVNTNRQSGGQNEGYAATGNFTLRATLK